MSEAWDRLVVYSAKDSLLAEYVEERVRLRGLIFSTRDPSLMSFYCQAQYEYKIKAYRRYEELTQSPMNQD